MMDTKLLIVGFRYIRTKFNRWNYGFSAKKDIFIVNTTNLEGRREATK